MTATTKAGAPITKASFPATAYTDPDPLLTLTDDVYETSDYGPEGDSFQAKRTLKWKAGTKIRTSQRDAMYAAATATNVTPATGSTAGGTAITITGTNFAGVTGVTVGGAAATNVKVRSNTKITCTTPAGTAGAKNIVIADENASVTMTNAFTYA